MQQNHQLPCNGRARSFEQFGFPAPGRRIERRITDHRINLTLHKLDEVLEGAMDAIIEPLVQEHHADQLAALSEAS